MKWAAERGGARFWRGFHFSASFLFTPHHFSVFFHSPRQRRKAWIPDTRSPEEGCERGVFTPVFPAKVERPVKFNRTPYKACD